MVPHMRTIPIFVIARRSQPTPGDAGTVAPVALSRA
jgi:hypothetical protein